MMMMMMVMVTMMTEGRGTGVVAKTERVMSEGGCGCVGGGVVMIVMVVEGEEVTEMTGVVTEGGEMTAKMTGEDEVNVNCEDLMNEEGDEVTEVMSE